MSDTSKKPNRQKVYTLLVQVGRSLEDDLPKSATGAALLCYASGVDEAEAVRETVAILKQAALSPLDVTGYGKREERIAQGHEIDSDCHSYTSQSARDGPLARMPSSALKKKPFDASQKVVDRALSAAMAIPRNTYSFVPTAFPHQFVSVNAYVCRL